MSCKKKYSAIIFAIMAARTRTKSFTHTTTIIPGKNWRKKYLIDNKTNRI